MWGSSEPGRRAWQNVDVIYAERLAGGLLADIAARWGTDRHTIAKIVMAGAVAAHRSEETSMTTDEAPVTELTESAATSMIQTVNTGH